MRSWRSCHDNDRPRQSRRDSRLANRRQLRRPASRTRRRSIEVRNISKRFGALQGADGRLAEARARLLPRLLGENGAGKSTLVKCIMGTYRADSGSVRVGTQEVELKNPRQAHALGIGMVYQHFTLVENMTVVENLIMAREHVPAVINWKAETEQLEDFMETMPFRVDPRALVRNLSAGEKQKVEILKQLYLRRKVLILDEPTSVLTPDEADEVLGMVRGMCEQGRLSVLMITHKFREVMAFCDEVTVLRHGRLMGEGAVRDLTREAMARMMMGDAELPAAGRPPRRQRTLRPTTSAWRFTSCAPTTRRASRPSRSCRLQSAPREIVGIAGVSGNGQRELVQVLAGQRDGQRRPHPRARRALPARPPRDAPAPLSRPARNAAAKRLRGQHDGGREPGLPRLRSAAAHAAAES